MTTTALTVAGLREDLRQMIAAETPDTEWVAWVEALIGREVSVTEQRHVLHALYGYRREPGMRMWQESVGRLARLLVAGGLK